MYLYVHLMNIPRYSTLFHLVWTAAPGAGEVSDGTGKALPGIQMWCTWGKIVATSS